MIYNAFGLRFHHFGLAVKEPSQALKYLSGLGYRHDPQILDPLQNVHLFMSWHDTMPAVEVIFPAGKGGPLDSMLAKRPEGIIYHLCYESNDVAVSLAAMESADLRVFEVSSPKPAILFGGKPVSFYLVAGVGLIEIIASASC